MYYIDNEGFFLQKNGGEPKLDKDIKMATEVKPTNAKPNFILLAAIAGVLLILSGQGIINVGPKPDPTPIPSPTPNPSPNPPNPNPPNPNPTPNVPVIEEEFPNLPPDYIAVSLPINSSLFKKETAEDALIYARYFRDGANVVRSDPTITSNSKFIKIHEQALSSLVNIYPGMNGRNGGLAKAIDDVLNTQGLEIKDWTETDRKKMAEAMDAISYRCAEAYGVLTNNPLQ